MTPACGNIFLSLDEARAELTRRRANTSLRKAVEAELGEYLMPELAAHPRAVIAPQLVTPNNRFIFFCHAANYVGAIPFVLEFLGDTFSKMNKGKRRLVSLLCRHGHIQMTVNIASPHGNDRRHIHDVTKHNGKRLIDFHRHILEMSGYGIEKMDATQWYHQFGRPCDYYYPYLLHFVLHGVLFEEFLTKDEDAHEGAFTDEVVHPAILKIQDKFGVAPMIVRLEPHKPTADEAFHWQSYPPSINEYILKYAHEHRLPMRELELPQCLGNCS